MVIEVDNDLDKEGNMEEWGGATAAIFGEPRLPKQTFVDDDGIRDCK